MMKRIHKMIFGISEEPAITNHHKPPKYVLASRDDERIAAGVLSPWRIDADGRQWYETHPSRGEIDE